MYYNRESGVSSENMESSSRPQESRGFIAIALKLWLLDYLEHRMVTPANRERQPRLALHRVYESLD
jgi:hypothetical protein